MALKPVDLEYFNREEVNIHEAIVAASKRARQVNEEVKIEFSQRVELITTKTESDTEENDINPDQLKMALEFEKREKPTDTALRELMGGDLAWRYREKEAAAPEADDEVVESGTDEE